MSFSISNSKLFDENSFYHAFIQDLLNCESEVIIESPFITNERTRLLIPVFSKLIYHGVKISIITRDPSEHFYSMEVQSEEAITKFEKLGIQVLLCIGNHHRKLAILDREILYEGSLNILSQTKSREIMRRIAGKEFALEMYEFLNYGRYI